MSPSRVSLSVLAGLCMVVLRLDGVAQTPQAPPPTFRSTLDLLTIDTSVREKDGQVVPDLQPSDFTVTVDGKPRRVVSAVFFKADASGGGRRIGGAAPTPQFVSNAGSAPGRVVIIALDAGTLVPGQEKSLLDTASRMIDGLSPTDAIGLVEIGGPTYIDVTRDHSIVSEALKRYWVPSSPETAGSATGSNIVTPPGVAAAPARAISLPNIAAAAHGEGLLQDLAKLVRDLAVVRAPRSVVLISGGFDFNPGLLARYKELQRAAAESRVVLYSVLLEHVGSIATSARGERRPDAADNPAKAEGLATIGSMTGGMFFNAAGMGTGIFDRIQSEVSSFYQLAIESSPAEADGKERDVKVRVNRPGVEVRAPAHIAVARPPKSPKPRDPLLDALQQPTDVPDVPIAVTTYSTHGTGTAVHVLVSAEIGAPGGAAPAEWGFEVRQNGKGVVNTRGRIAAGPGRPTLVSTTVEVPPGDYRLRVAAVDAEAHAGVLEVPFTAGLQKASAVTMSDLLVGVAGGGQLETRPRIARSETLTAMMEVRSETMPGGTLQLIPAGSARAALSIPLAPRPAISPGGPAILQGRASLEAVPPGRYTASAVVQIDGQSPTRIDRVVEVTGAPLVTSAPTGVAAPAAGPVAAAAPPPAPAAAAAGSPDEIMRRVAGYVEQYGGQASLLVAVEHYSQSVRMAGIVGTGRRAMPGDAVMQDRRLVSEFALVQNAAASGGWLGYRDVIELNGKPVADRGDRLQAIFRSGAPDLAQAKRIADEGARYNIGPVSRNFNVPTTTLFFFHADSLPRFIFRRTGRERIEGVDTVVIDFRETFSPTLIMNSASKDVPASGTLWVNPVDGAVVRTRLELEKFDEAGSRAVIDVRYQQDKALEMWVPARMEEKYSGGERETATTVATYKDFKRFQTAVKIK